MRREEIKKLVDQAVKKYLKEAKEKGYDSNSGFAYATGCLSTLLIEALKSLPEDHIVFRLLSED